MPDNSSSTTGKLLILSCLALTAGGYLFGLSFEEDQLAAAPIGSPDLDGDGLVDVQETILQTDAFLSDSDGDGFSDLEEFSRGSDPTLLADTPGALAGAVAMTGRVQSGIFRAVTAFFIPGGDLTGSTVTFGAMMGGVMVQLDPLLFFAGANLSVMPTGTNGDVIYLLETPVPESLLLALGNTALYATYSSAGATVVEAASSINLIATGGVVTQIVSNSLGTGSTYRPLADGPDIPATWTPAQVCVQNLTTVGVIGSVLQQEVDSAQCEPVTSDSYCPPDCSNLTGTIQEIIDPIGLIGG